VVVEPVGGTWMGGVVADTDFLEALREVTAKHGIILIFDEVITGFRLGLGGATAATGVVPDMVAFAKAIGGGFPMGAFGGRGEIMEAVVSPADPAPSGREKIFQSGTFQANLVSATAGLAMLDELEKPGVHAKLDRYGERIRTGLLEIAADLDIEMQAIGPGSIFGVYFSSTPIRNIRDLLASDRVMSGAFHLGLVANGLYITPYHLGFTNAAQTDEDIETVLETARRVLTQITELG
jgi:glutamate-1-semialdehyde 2,1-aminomutase